MRRGRLLVTVLAVLAWGQPAHAVAPVGVVAPMPLYVFAGQSNMVGFRSATTDLAFVRPTLLAPQPHALFWGPFDLHATAWAPLVSVTEFGTGASEFGFGPEVSAARVITADHHDGDIGVVKLAINNTNLYHDWNADRSDGFYNTLIATVHAALDALPRPGYVAGVLWMQGESDADDTLAHAQAYETNLTTLILHLRRDLGVSDLPFVEGQIGTRYPHSDIVRAAQAHVANNVARVRLVSTDDLPRDAGDPYHFTTESTIRLGERMAFAVDSSP